ncbi:unnamed protein product [Arctia plantaginis]|uniref:Uncharacterized protein n=1 Tax=Arctia plantaginis TaxID=874455 RepID=A0A8S1BH64_ARCPL|nr:unnamed protein product [Arctia plantaginis]
MLKYFIFSACLSVCLFFVTCEIAKEEECEWLGLKGKCVPPRMCLTTLDKRGDKAPTCANKGGEPTICCTDCELVNDTR